MDIKLEITVGSEEEFEALMELIDDAECDGVIENIQVTRT